ncbi:MAG: prepilin-type N-terminal cleavage/methylation domain-containing protein [Pyrinomonadaceae bacterium]|nr:prepilin-type N-terminal cleavage/methylation domain-containing protein [Phycisphaerales bacterium]
MIAKRGHAGERDVGRACRSAGALRRGGFSMIECVLSLVIVSVLLLACASVLTLTLRAETSSRSTSSPNAQSGAACRAASRIGEDLRLALAFSEVTPTAVTFTVPDRTGDAKPEKIRYAWAGAGSQLLRWQNDLPAGGAPIADNVQLLELSVPTRTVGPPPAPGTVEGSEVTLCTSNQTGLTDFGVNKDDWAGGYFKPVLPTNTISWRVTRAQIQLRRGGNNNPIFVRMHRADGNGQPTGAALESIAIPAASLPATNGWITVTFSSVTGLDPTQALVCVVGAPGAGSNSAHVQFKSFLLGGVAGMSWTTTTNAGASWTSPLAGGVLLNKAMQLSVYGRITVQP